LVEVDMQPDEVTNKYCKNMRNTVEFYDIGNTKDTKEMVG